MTSGRYIKEADISRLDPKLPRCTRYSAKHANLTTITYSELYPGVKRINFRFKNDTAEREFLTLFKSRIQLTKIPFDSLLAPNYILSGYTSTTSDLDHLKLILSIVCDYAEIDGSLKSEICHLPDLILSPFVEELCNLADTNFNDAKEAIQTFKIIVLWHQEDLKKHLDFIDSLMYQLGSHFERNKTYDKAIVCYDSIKEGNRYFELAKLHREYCYKLFMETDQSPLLKEVTLLRKELADLKVRFTTMEQTSPAPQDDKKQQNSGAVSKLWR